MKCATLTQLYVIIRRLLKGTVCIYSKDLGNDNSDGSSNPDNFSGHTPLNHRFKIYSNSDDHLIGTKIKYHCVFLVRTKSGASDIFQWWIQYFPYGGVDLVRGYRLPRRLHFENFVCQNERIWTLGGGVVLATPPRSANVLGICGYMSVCALIPELVEVFVYENPKIYMHRSIR